MNFKYQDTSNITFPMPWQGTKSRFVKIWFWFYVLTFHYKAHYIGGKEWVSFYFACIQ